ncbi:MAG: DUF6465 family protein [Johnsonella sp.]|nr:DUF6465 family protein [Johnsonella sp.]
MAEEKKISEQVEEAVVPKRRGRKPGSKNAPKTDKVTGAEVKTEKKKTEKKAPAKKALVKKSTEKKTEKEIKETKELKESKTSRAKKTEPKTTIVIEYEGRPILAKDVVARALKAYKKANKGAVIKKVDIYIKPEENAAYYVVNGDASPSYKITL